MSIKEVIKISRPRFWLYTLGPFMIGYIAGGNDVLFWKNINYAVFSLYFLIPANILIYGINDLSDEDTDKYNKRKGESGYESELQKSQRFQLWIWVIGSALIGVLISLQSVNLFFGMLLFLFLSIFYSAKPIRFKARPFLDAYSNFLYVVPALIGYVVTTGDFPPPIWMFIGLLWVAGMHTFSAIPDIGADKKAGVITTAVKLGKKKALIFVGANWLVFSILIISQVGLAMLPALVYPLLTAYLFNKDIQVITKFYKYLPILNGILGLVAFWYILISKYSIENILENIPF